MNHVAKKAGTSRPTVLRRSGLLVVLAVLVVLTGCSGAGSIIGGKSRSPQEAIRITPQDRAEDVKADAEVEVKVPDGRLESVRVTRIEDAQRQEVRA